MVTKPNKFQSGDQLIDLFAEFCRSIEDCGYEAIPSQSGFCRWLEDNFKKTDRKTIYNSLNKIFPNIKKDFERLQSDTMAAGGMLGKYQPTMTIFALKNWCGWGDNGRLADYGTQEEEDDPLTKSLKEEAERLGENAD